MTHPHRSKKAWSTVRVSAKDARDLTLMLRLHRAYCEDEIDKCHKALSWDTSYQERMRIEKSAKSWRRAARKAESFAGQFEEMALEAENGMACAPRQLR